MIGKLMPAFVIAACLASASRAADATKARPDKTPSKSHAGSSKAKKGKPPKKQLFTGKVVLLRDALKRRGIVAYAKEVQNQVVLKTATGELVPLVPDWRGRAFFQDKRLRNRKVELVGFRRPGVPYLQVLMVFTFDKKGTRQYFDYWCDVCSIPMYEIKSCECCQGPIRMRFQPRELPSYLRSNSTKKAEHQTGGKD